MRGGFQSSLHYHPIKNETMYVLNNRMQIESPKGNIKSVFPGDIIDIPAGTEHRFINNFTHQCVFLEFSTPHSDNDVVRLEKSSAI